MEHPSLQEQLKEAKRELRAKRTYFPGFVARGSITADTAAWRLRCQEAIIATLEACIKAQDRQLTLAYGKEEA